MIDHVQQIMTAHLAEIGLFVLVATAASAMRLYGRHLERRTREYGRTRDART